MVAGNERTTRSSSSSPQKKQQAAAGGSRTRGGAAAAAANASAASSAEAESVATAVAAAAAGSSDTPPPTLVSVPQPVPLLVPVIVPSTIAENSAVAAASAQGQPDHQQQPPPLQLASRAAGSDIKEETAGGGESVHVYEAVEGGPKILVSVKPTQDCSALTDGGDKVTAATAAPALVHGVGTQEALIRAANASYQEFTANLGLTPTSVGGVSLHTQSNVMDNNGGGATYFTPGGMAVPGSSAMMSGSVSSPDMESVPMNKREVRLQKNREAAKECRRKKKEYVRCLESRVAVLEAQNSKLMEELKTLKDMYCHKVEETSNVGAPPDGTVTVTVPGQGTVNVAMLNGMAPPPPPPQAANPQ